MSIIDIFKEKHPLFEYYGKSDLSTGWLVTRLLEHEKAIVDYLANIDAGKMSMNLFIDYNWLSNMVPAEEVIPYVIETRRESFKLLIEMMQSALKLISLTEVLKYIGTNFEIIFDKKTYGEHTLVFHKIVERTFAIIYKHFSSFKVQVFDYLETHFGYLIIRNISLCEAYYKKNPSRLSIALNKDENQHLFELHNFPNTFKSLAKSKQIFVKEIIKMKTDRALKQSIEAITNINGDNFPQVFAQTEPIIKRVRENPGIRTIDLYKIDEMENLIENASREYFEKHGQKWSSDPIDLKPEIEKLKKNICDKDKEVSFVTYLSLTHSYDKVLSRIGTNLSAITFGEKSKGLLDFMDQTPNTDGYFTSNSIIQLGTLIDINGIVLTHILLDPESESCFREHLLVQLNDIDRNESNGSLELIQLFEGFYPSLLKFVRIEQKKFDSVERYEMYCNSLFIVTAIEKILRKVAINRNSDIMYYSEDDLSLGDILRTKNNNGSDYTNSMLTGVFDEELVRVLEYYLGKTADTNIGLNIRNNLAHNRNITFSKLRNDLQITIFYLFLSVVNAVYANYLNQNYAVE